MALKKPVICGVTEVDEGNKEGRFRYGKSDLARPDAFALDPIHLSLSENQYQTRFNQGVFGVLANSGPEPWGESNSVYTSFFNNTNIQIMRLHRRTLTCIS